MKPILKQLSIWGLVFVFSTGNLGGTLKSSHHQESNHLLAPATLFATLNSSRQVSTEEWINVVQNLIIPEIESMGLATDEEFTNSILVRELLLIFKGHRGTSPEEFASQLQHYAYSLERQQSYKRWHNAFLQAQQQPDARWNRNDIAPEQFDFQDYPNSSLIDLWNQIPTMGKKYLCQVLGITMEQVQKGTNLKKGDITYPDRIKERILKEVLEFLGSMKKRDGQLILFRSLRFGLQRVILRSLTYPKGKNGTGRMPLLKYVSKELAYTDDELRELAESLSLHNPIRTKKKMPRKVRRKLLMVVAEELFFRYLTGTLPSGLIDQKYRQAIANLVKHGSLNRINNISEKLADHGTKPTIVQMFQRNYLLNLPQVQQKIKQIFNQGQVGTRLGRFLARLAKVIGIRTRTMKHIEECSMTGFLLEVVHGDKQTLEIMSTALKQAAYERKNETRKAKLLKKLGVTSMTIVLLLAMELEPIRSYFVHSQIDGIVHLYFLFHPEHTIIDLLENIKQGKKPSVHILFNLSQEPEYQRLILRLCLLFWKGGKLTPEEETAFYARTVVTE